MLQSKKLPRLAITLGDPSGIGPEVILKALADPTLHQQCDLTIVGSDRILQQTYQQLQNQGFQVAKPNQLRVISLDPDPNLPPLEIGVGNQTSGTVSFQYLDTAITRTLQGEFDGVITGPIAKNLWNLAGHNYPGQTEFLAEKAKVKRFGMLFVARSPYTGWTLRTLLVTTHIPLSQISQTLTPELMSLKLELLVDCLRHEFGLENPRIALAGLNPHSGENGQLGTEEKDWLIPWLNQQRDRYPYIQLDGPIPPDTMWVKPGQAWFNLGKNAHDAYIALYHDQGLIPVKLMAFDRAVNTTIGLPFIRTSPDHGTAFDIAGKGIADGSSMKAAIDLGIELVNNRINP
jgi:4-hydroxythreonine-4-phosphate dehydrogenase